MPSLLLVNNTNTNRHPNHYKILVINRCLSAIITINREYCYEHWLKLTKVLLHISIHHLCLRTFNIKDYCCSRSCYYFIFNLNALSLLLDSHAVIFEYLNHF